MGIMNSSGGKGSATRPSSVSRETFENNFERIFGKKKKDPVKNCEVYKQEGCSHVDGVLCEFDTCEVRNARTNV